MSETRKAVRYLRKQIKETPFYHCLFDEDDKKMVSAALTTQNDRGEAILWIISTAYESRKKGYATALLLQLQETFVQIETQWLNDVSKKLLIRCGFDYIEPNGKDMVWVKPEEEE